MKNLILTPLLVLLISVGFAQAPDSINFQGVLKDPNGALIKDQEVGVRIGIYQGSEDGTKVFEETHTVTSSATGQIYFLIGSGANISGSIGEIDWSKGPYFLKREVDLAGGTNYTINGASQFFSLPYSKYADVTGNALDISEVRVSEENDSLFIGKNSFVIIPGLTLANSLVDYDGNVYSTVTIGTQEWMAENLKVTHLNDGTEIPLAWGGQYMAAATSPMRDYTDLMNNEDSTGYNTNRDIYGALYNWYAVSSGKLCPTGWHVPSRDELSTLNTFLGSNVGLKLREVGTAHWFSDNGATDEYGFSALPGGIYNSIGSQAGGNVFYIWSSTERDANSAYARFITRFLTNFGEATTTESRKTYGMSVRCLKD